MDGQTDRRTDRHRPSFRFRNSPDLRYVGRMTKNSEPILGSYKRQLSPHRIVQLSCCCYLRQRSSGGTVIPVCLLVNGISQKVIDEFFTKLCRMPRANR